MPPGYKWKPIADLPRDAGELTSGELDALYLVWTEQQASLEQGSRLEEFNQMLAREWSIETGIIEGVYSLDRGTTEILIQRGIDSELIPRSPETDPVLVAAMIQGHQSVLEGLFAFIKGERALSVGYIKELHAELLRHQESVRVVDQFGEVFEKRLEKGKYKSSLNNPTRPDGALHEYCPPEHVAAEMDRLVALHQEHIRKGVVPEIQAGWLHHAFTQIHPFDDGNGRVARAIATLVFVKSEWFPLVITRDDRLGYIEALEVADAGDLKPLVSLFTKVQKRSVTQAIELVSKVKPVQSVDEAVAAARARLVTQGEIIPKEWNQAKVTANGLLNIATDRLNQVAQKLSSEIASVKPGFQFLVSTGSPQFNLPQDIAAQLGYVANLTEFHQWVQLSLKTDRTYGLVFSFHGLGTQFRGLVAASAFLYTDGSAPTPVTEDFFQINYKEAAADAQKRFQPWMEAAIVKGLTLWNQQL